MESFVNKAIEIATDAGSKILLALLIFIIGRIIIGKILKIIDKSSFTQKMEPTVKSFLHSFIKIGLYVILVISIINVLGVPMASVITVLASAGVAVGLALQGALTNLAGGILIMLLRPFKVGDYVASAGEEGVVKEITLFYTTLLTVDNRRIIIPNGTLMNANVTNFSTEETRRVDLVFSCGKGENVQKVQDLMIGVMKKNSLVLKNPAPFAQLSGGTNEAMEFTVRAWAKTADYWDTYFQLTQQITEALGEAGVKAPAVRIIQA